jgi:AsmA-like protein
MKYVRRTVLVLILLVLAFGLIAPHVRADRLGPRIQAAIEAALHRKVHIGAVYLNLFTGPGFTVEGVLIDDDPSAGIEPFAHVDSMRARVRLTSLLTGHLAFSSLKLDNPSVNLVKMQSGPWNIQPLLDRTSNSNAAHAHSVPDIQIFDGRLNFKFGDTKSVFYISGADVDIYPNADGDVVIRFSGAPARTDRGSQAFGLLSARGLLKSGPNGEDQLNMGLRLERTAISEIARLFNGRDVGVHGAVIANARLSGPLSHLELTGDLNVNDIHRWDLMPAKGEGWTLNYRGYLDLRAHQLEVETLTSEGQPTPVAVKLLLSDYLSAPKWIASCAFHDLPAASLLETARHMGAPFPPGVQVEGKVQGGIGYSNDGGLKGELALANASVKFLRGGAAEFSSSPVSIDGQAIAFGPAEVRMDNGQSATIEGRYALDESHMQLKISTSKLTIAEVQASAERVVSATPIPLLEKLRQGTWKGWIAFDRTGDTEGLWSGDYELQNAVMDIPDLAAPLRFSAAVEMKAGAIQMSRIHARAGDVRLDGEYRYDPEAKRPHRVRVTVPELQLAELEHLMLPALQRDEGFLARTFRLRKPTLPKWLEQRELEGSIEVNRLLNGDSLLGSLSARVTWDGANILLSNMDCRLEAMRGSGKMAVNLTRAVPSYILNGRVENLDYKNGTLDLEGELETSGIGENLLLNIRSQGNFEGHGIELSAESLVREISGAYRVIASAGVPRLLLTNVQLTQGADTFYGQGSSQPDGHVILELASGRRQMRLTGMLLPVHPEQPPAR